MFRDRGMQAPRRHTEAAREQFNRGCGGLMGDHMELLHRGAGGGERFAHERWQVLARELVHALAVHLELVAGAVRRREVIGGQAMPAALHLAPRLAVRLDEPDVDERGENAKLIVEAFRNKAPTAKFPRLAALEAFEYLGDRGKIAVPELLEATREKTVTLRQFAVTIREGAVKALARFPKEGTKIVPTLVELLRETDDPLRKATIQALGRFGPDALLAVPKLKEIALNDPAYQALVQAALEQIEPTKKKDE